MKQEKSVNFLRYLAVFLIVVGVVLLSLGVAAKSGVGILMGIILIGLNVKPAVDLIRSRKVAK